MFMNITTRIQKLTIERRILLSQRLREELFSRSEDPREDLSLTNEQLSWKLSGRPHSQLRIDSQRKMFSILHTNQEKPTRLVAYLVFTTDCVPVNSETDSGNWSGSMKKGDVRKNQQGNSITLSELRNFLRARLPDFMMPSVYVVLKQLPRTNTGKVDYQALLDLPVSEGRPDKQVELPANETQRQLLSIWSAALGLNRIGMRDNFFALGGHSLLIAQVVSQIRSIMGVDIALRSLFDYPTIETLSEAIDTLQWTKKENTVSSGSSSSGREQFEI